MVSIALLEAGLLVVGARLEDTLWLPGNGKGLFQHYAIWTIAFTNPMLLFAVAYAYRRFRSALATLPLTNDGAARSRYRTRRHNHLDVLRMRQFGILLYLLLLLVGFLAWLNNIYQTTVPIEHYGNDVFDANSYFWASIASKCLLFTSWIIIYPIAGFYTLVMSGSLWLIVSELTKNGRITPKVTHPDRCFGLRNLGTLNIALYIPYLLVYIVIFSLFITHRNIYRPN